MHIGIITPAKIKSLSGNRATAVRWAEFLQQQGHKVSISVQWDATPYDLMIALHSWRSAESIAAFRQQFPDRPLIVALTGTDLYRFILSHPEPTLKSIELADRLVVLHDLAYKVLPQQARDKVTVIYQSALPLPSPRKPGVRHFDVCVVGHLRNEKDPFRAALAARELPTDSHIRIQHYGKAHSEEWGQQAQKEMAVNPRYHWHGEIPHWKIRQAYSRCQVMVLSSTMEGGANVISEATVAGIPVIASEIDGSVGLLGDDYPGYYPVGDTLALQKLLLRAEGDPAFLASLVEHGDRKAQQFTPVAESQGWEKLLSNSDPVGAVP